MAKPENKRKRTVGDIISLIVMIIALGVFCYSGFYLVTKWLDYKESSDEYKALDQQYAGEEVDPDQVETEDQNGGLKAMKNPIDFASLKKINTEIIGWIKIKAIDVSYPMAQGKDNDFYLHNTFEKTYNFAGCIFLNDANKKDFSDVNSIVYGHNMRNGSMFGKLKNFYEDGVYEKSPYFWIYTPEKIYKYKIFSCREVASNSDAYQIGFRDGDFTKYINKAFEQSVVKSDITVAPGDKIVTLSTCTGNDATRFIVQGKLEKTYLSK